MSTYIVIYPDELNHFGVKGMKWGVRKQQNYHTNNSSNKRHNFKKAAKIGAAVALTGIAAYGAYKYGPALLSKNNKSYALSGQQLRKMGIATFEPDRIHISKSPVTKIGQAREAAKSSFYNKHGKSFASSNITKSKKFNSYSNKNLTEIGRAERKIDFYTKAYDRKLKEFKQPSANKESLTKDIIRLRDDIGKARTSYQDSFAKAMAKDVNEIMNGSYYTDGKMAATNLFTRNKKINFRKLN